MFPINGRRWKTEVAKLLLAVCVLFFTVGSLGMGQNHVSVDFLTSYVYETRRVEPITSDQELIGYIQANTHLYNKDLTGDVVHNPTLVYSSSKPISWVSYREYLIPPYRWEFPDLEENKGYLVAAGYNPPAGDIRFKFGCDVDYFVDKVEFKAPGGKQTVKLTLEPKDWNLMVLGELELWMGVEETDEVVPRILSIKPNRGQTSLDPKGMSAWWTSEKGPGGKYEVEVVIDVEVKEGHKLVRYLPTVEVQVKLLQGKGKEGPKKKLVRVAKTGIGGWKWETSKPCVWNWEEWVRKVVRYEGISAPGFHPPTDAAIEEAIEKGLAWLAGIQNPDGSWNYSSAEWGQQESVSSVGVTALAALAFLLHGHSEDEGVVNKAIKYILAHRHPGSVFFSDKHGAPTYETSLSILALLATNNPEYADAIAEARDWLASAQNDEGSVFPSGLACSAPESCWAYGGWCYGYPCDYSDQRVPPERRPFIWADLSNTQFALMALKASGLPPDASVWRKAEGFISRCQNLDGGFNYMPPWRFREKLVGTASYGSMTAAGIWGLRLRGVPVDDVRIQKALSWLKRFYSYWNNPRSQVWHYNYLWTVTRAFLYSGLPGVLKPAPPLEGWYWDFAGYLVEMQQEDGRWVSTDPEREPPELATCFALLTLEKATLPKPFGP